MDQLTPTPRYRLLEDTFFEPDLIPKGSIVETWGPPGPHLDPLNASAREALEAWYDEEFTFKVKDPSGGEDLIRTHRPHEQFRMTAAGAAGQRQAVTVLSPPPKSTAGNLSLATLGTKASTDQRPPPELVAEVPEEFREDIAVVTKAKPETTLTSSRRA